MKTILIIALVVGCATSMAAQTNQTISWHDSVRDVYIDNELDRTAQFLVSDNPSRAAIICSKLNKAIVLDIDSHTVNIIPKDKFKFSADRAEATSDGAYEKAGKFTRIDGPVYSFAIDGKPVLIRPHTGETGVMNQTKLWEIVPVWKALMDNYKPDPSTVEALKSVDKDTDVTLLFGTWCGDSRHYIPQVMRALTEAGNNKLHLKLIGIDNQFRQPSDTVQPLHLTNVPTIIVERGGKEIGRIVETPATNSLESDLAAILSGKTPVHNGRWERGPLIAKGSYSYRNRNGQEIGTESWELFNAVEGGFFAHSRITAEGMSTEVYERVDASFRPAFAEITKISGDQRIRTRISVDGHTLTARVRGSASGVATQTLEVPDKFFLSTPAIVTQGWCEASAGSKNTIYLEPFEFQNSLGTLATVSYDGILSPAMVQVPAGTFLATIAGRPGDWQCEIHSRLKIPVKCTIGDVQYLLTSTTIQPDTK